MNYRHLFLVLCLASAIVFPVAAAFDVGTQKGWIQINCNVDGATVSFDGQYEGVITGGSLTVMVYTTVTT
jgi:hypothetical protein